MRGLYKPYTIFLSVTLPQVILFGIFGRLLYVINTELVQESIITWKLTAAYLIFTFLGYSLYGLYTWIKKGELHQYVALSMVFLYSGFLALYWFNIDVLIPSTIPNWMLLGIPPLATVLTLVMPALLHALLITVHWLSEKYRVGNISKEIAILIGIPVGWYMLFHFSALIFRTISIVPAMEKAIYILFISSAVAFFFLLIRIIYYAMSNRINMWQRYFSVIIIIGSVLGLMLNKGIGNIFGDFSHIGYYILAIATGGLVGIPSEKHEKLKLAIYFGKSITFVYSCYFFLVFLPYLPLSIIGIIFLGLGLLMLVPFLLIFAHIKSLYQDFNYLKNSYNKTILLGVFIVGLLVIPILMLTNVSKDRYHIDNALRYTYQRSYNVANSEDLNLAGIRRVINNIKDQSMGARDFFSTNKKTPYLSAIYNRYVLDGLSLSMDRISYLEAIFFGSPYNSITNNVFINENPTIILEKPLVETRYDEEEGSYKSWIHLELTNTTEWQNEYITNFQLPEGSYISDYYLYVFGEKKHGLMADKRAANWIYQQIRAIRRDPGILTYIGDNFIEFKVFPFEGMEKRRTGIEITHKSPIELQLDNEILYLTNNGGAINIGQDTIEGVSFVSKEEKTRMKKVVRELEYYFILDYSEGNSINLDDYYNRVEDYISKENIADLVGEIIAVSYQEERVDYKEGWEAELNKHPQKGGLYLDYTMKRILNDNYTRNKETRPVFIVVTNDINRAILQRNYDSYKFTAPEGLNYYHLDNSGHLFEYSLLDSQRPPMEVGGIKEEAVLEWKDYTGTNYYIPDNSEDSIVIVNLDINPIDVENNSKWENGVLLKSNYRRSLLQPDKSFEASLDIVKDSISSGVMTPLTSYIVLETEAQEKTMLEKQKQLLAARNYLDLEVDGFTQMSEPNIIIMLLIFAVILIFANKKRLINVVRR